MSKSESSGKVDSGSKLLIVNGDDFGLSHEVNAGIIQAHLQGVLTSASIMVTAPASSEAVELAKQYPSLDVGLHLVLCDGTSCLAPEKIPGLVDSSGRFPSHEVWAGIAYTLSPRLRDVLQAECRAQIEAHLDKIGNLSHINGHRNLHLHPAVIGVLAPLLEEYRVPYVRLIREPLYVTIRLARDRLVRKLIDSAFFTLMSLIAERRLATSGVKFVDRVFGFLQSGHLTEAYTCGVIGALRPNTVTEFYFHPAISLKNPQSQWRRQNLETQILTGERIVRVIAEQKVKLTSFRSLSGGCGAANLHRHDGHR